MGRPNDGSQILIRFSCGSISIDQVQNYLGVLFSPAGARADVATKLKDGQLNLSSAPLKPQQRMYCLNHHLISAFYRQLTLAPCTDKYLGWIDKSIRSAIRSWLKLPKDTPTASSTRGSLTEDLVYRCLVKQSHFSNINELQTCAEVRTL